MTSLPFALSWRATARTSKAVSAFSPRENRLNEGRAVVGAVVMGARDPGERNSSRRHHPSRWGNRPDFRSLQRLRKSREVSLLGRDGLRQRADDCGNYMSVHQFLTDFALIGVRLAEGLVRLATPVLPDREVNANRRLGKLARANLIGVGARLNAQPALQAAVFVEREHE